MEVHLVNNDPQNLTKNKDVFVDDLIKLNDDEDLLELALKNLEIDNLVA